ncbi:hypothetical protein [Pseudotamlana carrageenivorans]|uniref:hypothetical protein n=1 Tax=Pseudotamlana carrageenivorans TaxID=2069432 RepID=UPI0018F01EF6|nr:hypothetical protein [Tamlana carrageenivorans]
MIKRTKASISKCILHKVGNKFNSTKNTFSEQPIDFDEASYDLILPYLLRPFSSVAESYRFNPDSADLYLKSVGCSILLSCNDF